jgi:hypothetical protein
MVKVQTSDVDAKAAPTPLEYQGLFGNHGNQITVLWQLKPCLWNNGSHSSTTVTMVSDITTETKVCSLLQSNNATDTVLLNVRKARDLVL